MAVKKKPAAGGEGEGSGDTGLYIIIAFVVIAFVVFGMGALFNVRFLNIEYFFDKISGVAGPVGRAIVSAHTWNIIFNISAAISVFCIALIIFSTVRMYEIQQMEKQELDHEIGLALARDHEIEQKENSRWRYILGLVESESESDWRIAILEADSMMDELLQEKGYSGDTLGERLKNARSDAFLTIDNAWEAHEVRNKIAHSGSDFALSQLESRRTIRLFETVFEEFGVV